MAKIWTLYDVDNPIDADGTTDQTERCITLFKDTAKVHLRDFASVTAANLKTKINTKAKGFNWIKLSCRAQDTDPKDIDIVIAYHLVRHRGLEWTISVGFLQSLLPDPDPTQDPNDNTYAYVPFTKELHNIIKGDLAGIIPARRRWFSIDDLGPNADGSTPVAARRSTKIGEVGYVAEYNDDIRRYWRRVSSGKEPKPKYPHPDHAKPIPGWGRPADSDIYVSEIGT